MIDHLDSRRVIDRILGEGKELPAMLEVLQNSGFESFYRNDGSEYLGVDGQYHSVN